MRMQAPARSADASVERELAAIAQQSCELLRREVPEYAGLPSAALLDGTLEIVRAALAAEFGLDPDEHYFAFRARIPTPEARRRFEEAVEGAGLTESHQGELVGDVIVVECHAVSRLAKDRKKAPCGARFSTRSKQS